MGDNKRNRFVRIAEARTNRIIDMLRLLANCSNRSNYDYTEEDVRKIFGAIEHEVKEARNAFSSTGSKKEKFSLE